jgi:hypothetical protein
VTSRPVLVAFSVLAGLQVLTGGALLGDVFGPKVAGAAVLVVASAQAGLTFYVRGMVPAAAVAAQRTPDGSLVAGPAAPGRTDVGEIVDVVPADTALPPDALRF